MFTNPKNNSKSHFTVLAVLWLVNILILIFGLPFLFFKKMRELFRKPAKNSLPETAAQTSSSQYFSPQINSKL